MVTFSDKYLKQKTNQNKKRKEWGSYRVYLPVLDNLMFTVPDLMLTCFDSKFELFWTARSR